MNSIPIQLATAIIIEIHEMKDVDLIASRTPPHSGWQDITRPHTS